MENTVIFVLEDTEMLAALQGAWTAMEGASRGGQFSHRSRRWPRLIPLSALRRFRWRPLRTLNGEPSQQDWIRSWGQSDAWYQRELVDHSPPDAPYGLYTILARLSDGGYTLRPMTVESASRYSVGIIPDGYPHGSVDFAAAFVRAFGATNVVVV